MSRHSANTETCDQQYALAVKSPYFTVPTWLITPMPKIVMTMITMIIITKNDMDYQ